MSIISNLHYHKLSVVIKLNLNISSTYKLIKYVGMYLITKLFVYLCINRNYLLKPSSFTYRYYSLLFKTVEF